MKNLVRGLIIGYLLASMCNFTFATGITESIEVLINSVNLSFEGEMVTTSGKDYKLAKGEEVPYSIAYKGTTYLPIQKICELTGFRINWDENTKTIDLETDNVAVNVMKDNNLEDNKNYLITEPYSLNSINNHTYIDVLTLKKIYDLLGREIILSESSSREIACILNNDSILVGDNGILSEDDVKAVINELGQVVYTKEETVYIKDISDSKEKNTKTLSSDSTIIYQKEILGQELQTSGFELIKLDWKRVNDNSIDVICTLKNNNKDYNNFCYFKLGVYDITDNNLLSSTNIDYQEFKIGETKTIKQKIDIDSEDIYLDIFFDLGF